MEKRTFNLIQLLTDIRSFNAKIANWKDLEKFTHLAAQIQDPRASRNNESHPDILLSNGFGIECKTTDSYTRDINLNSSAPEQNIFYLVALIKNKKIKDMALVCGANFYCIEIDSIKKINTSLRNLSNTNVRYRTRVMWQIKSPFEIWGRATYVVNKLGKVIPC